MLADCDGGDESSLLLCSQSLHNLFTASPCTAPSNWRYNRYTMRRPLSFFVTFDIHLFNDLAIGHTGAAYAMYAVIGSLLLNHVRSHRLRIVSKEKEMVTPFMNGRERVECRVGHWNSSLWWPCSLTLSLQRTRQVKMCSKLVK